MSSAEPVRTAAEAVRTAAEAAARRAVGAVAGALAGEEAAVHGAGRLAADGAGRLAADGDVPGRDTVFQIGSVTKVVTAVLLADAVVRREISLDTPLTDVVPAPEGVTLGSLATHTSGLPRLPAGFGRAARRNPTNPYRDYGADDVLAALAETRLTGAGRYGYSNFGYGVLGLVLARIGGRSYEDLVAERVTGPLGLRDTGVVLRPDQAARKATGHSWWRRARPDWEFGGMQGAGALWSTVDDVLRLLRAHREPGSTPLAPALRLVQEPRVTVSSRLRLGLGWHISAFGRARRTALWHNGGTGGFRSFAALAPDRGAAVTVLSNSTRPVDGVAVRLLDRLTAG